MTIDRIMSNDVVTVSPDTALMELRQLLHKRGFHHLLVVDDAGQLIGMISDRDVLRAISPFLDTSSESHRDVRTLGEPAREIMRADPITVTPHTTVEDAAHRLLDHSISALPVVDDSGQLIGIVTTKDLLDHYTDNSNAS